MKINEIKAALANLAQKVEPVTVTSVTPPKAEVKATAPEDSSKNTATVTSANHGAAVPVASKQSTRTPSTKRSVSTKAATTVPVTKDVAPVVTVPAQIEPKPLPMVDQEAKPVTATTKKATTRKPKTATVIPMDSIEIVVAKYLKAGVDYAVIPGCGKKPALLKAGAEKLAAIYGYRSTSQVINRVERYDQLFVLYEVETTIYDSEGNILAVGLGSCNTKERRYQKGDFAANLNTVTKMARKRSYVDGILTATHASGVFTQDIEDIAIDNTRMEVVG